MNAKSAAALVVAVLFLVLFLVVIGQGVPGVPVTALSPATAGAAMWNARTYEVILQGLIILSGVAAILLLLRKDTSGEMPP
jgi:hypothetical protein